MENNQNYHQTVMAHLWLRGVGASTGSAPKDAYAHVCKSLGVAPQGALEFQDTDHLDRIWKGVCPTSSATSNLRRALCLALLSSKVDKGLDKARRVGDALYVPVTSFGAIQSFYVRKGLSGKKAANKIEKIKALQETTVWRHGLEYMVIPMGNDPILKFFIQGNLKDFTTHDTTFVWKNIEGIHLRDGWPYILSGENWYRVTHHVIDQWCMRSKKSTPKKEDAVQVLMKMLEEGVPMKRKNHLRQILKNDFRLSEYLGWQGWVLVIEEGNVLKTCYFKGVGYPGYQELEK